MDIDVPASTHSLMASIYVVLPGVGGIIGTVILIFRVEIPLTVSEVLHQAYDPLAVVAVPDPNSIIIFFLVPIPSIDPVHTLSNVFSIECFEVFVGPRANISSSRPVNSDFVGTICKLHFEIDALF